MRGEGCSFSEYVKLFFLFLIFFFPPVPANWDFSEYLLKSQLPNSRLSSRYTTATLMLFMFCRANSFTVACECVTGASFIGLVHRGGSI